MQVFKTGQVAEICKVSQRTVVGWLDEGHLSGYKLPGSGVRRVTREQLEKFMREHGMPMDGLPSDDPQKAK